ncbi:hypothetical protein [Alkalihalobacillus sp. R86527]|uniref:hypothetical protein n=1 Tax=Alkalihalobacillus sp. R86527 TaxID=3093863 RepID=UPI00366EAB85
MEDRLKNMETLVASLIQIIGSLRKEQSLLEARYSQLQSSYDALLCEISSYNPSIDSPLTPHHSEQTPLCDI